VYFSDYQEYTIYFQKIKLFMNNSGFGTGSALTKDGNYVIFSLLKAAMKTYAFCKIPREEPIWCNGSVPPQSCTPLLSCRLEIAGRVRPLKRQ
jgi:hypothetical protein